MDRSPVTFMLPGNNRSGGVRVTALMGNILLGRGRRVRIIHPNARFASRAVASLAGCIRRVSHDEDATGWLDAFSGTVERYGDVNAIRFSAREIVIGVGTYMVPELMKIRAPDVVKIRYNHGFPSRMTSAARKAWSFPMPTITVSHTLVPQLEALSGTKVCAVVPNGIDTSEYYPAPAGCRNAIGTIYSVHPNKAPEDIVRIMGRLEKEFPLNPTLMFGTEPRPRGLPRCTYERYPSIARARDLYSQSLIWLVASRTEGLPGAVLEAMACRAVVVSTANQGSLEVIKDGINGMIVPIGDVGAFVRRIRELLSNDSLRARLADAGLATAKQFTWERAATRMEQFLAGVDDLLLQANGHSSH